MEQSEAKNATEERIQVLLDLINAHLSGVDVAFRGLTAVATESNEALLNDRLPLLYEALGKAKEFTAAVFTFMETLPEGARKMDWSEAVDRFFNRPPRSASFSVRFDSKAAERLDRLAKDDQGKGEVLGQALALEDLFRRVTAQGSRVLVQRPDGSVAEVLRP
jgi:hypothetical protein